MNCGEALDLLGALEDGELDAGTRAALEAHLEGCASCAAARRSLAALSAAVRGGAPYHRAPEDVREAVGRALRAGSGRARPAESWRARVAPALAGAAAGFACAALLLSPVAPPPLPEAVALHSEALLSGALTEVRSTDHHQVKPWFSRHVPFSPPLPELAAEGFPLEGGRTDSLGGETAAVLVYGRGLHVIDVFVLPAAGGDSAPAAGSARGFNVVAWRRGGFSFQAVSDLNAPELRRFVELMRTSP